MGILSAGLILFWLIAAAAIIFLFERFRASVRRYSETGYADDELPDAVVILSLRGSDESLNETLDGLAAQDYPRFQIRVVVDHPTDPANRIVQEWHRRHSDAPIAVEYLTAPNPTSTLKASAIHQVLRSLNPAPGAVVLVDGDADPYPLWLRDAVRPLGSASIGAVTGNRWYLPRHGGLASWCRFIFSALSLPTMQNEGYAWGGTLAIRGDLACSESFLMLLAQRPTEEQATYEAMREAKRRLTFNPQLVQWNPESIELENLPSFLFRQLMMARFYYPTWNQLFYGAIVVSGVSLASLTLLAAAYANQIEFWAWPTAAGLGFCALFAVELQLLHRTLQQRVFDRQGRSLPTMHSREWFSLVVAMPLILAAYVTAIVRVQNATEAVWRRIRYWFHEDGIELDEYRPFVLADANPTAADSPAPAFARRHAT